MKQEYRGVTEDGKTYDAETGEVAEGALVWIPERKRSLFGREFFLMAQDALSVMADHRHLIGSEGFAVFAKLIQRLDFENYIQVSQAEIAGELGMKPANVSRAMARLVRLGIVGKGPKVGSSRTYRLHPSAGWKGKPHEHQRAQEQARAMGWKLIDGGSEAPNEGAQPELPL